MSSLLQKTLPQLSDALFLTDGGMETTLIFHEGIELPHFAAFHLLASESGRTALSKYYRTYAAMARKYGVGLVLESPSWRANPDWAEKLGYNKRSLDDANRESVGLMHEIREAYESAEAPMVISGCVGPRGDGYEPSALMSAAEAAEYHSPQVRTLRDAGADFVSAFTMNYADEALGFANAAAACEIPAVISFTLETDGRLPTGQTLHEVIDYVDSQAAMAPVYYMINCAHPTHFSTVLPQGASWLKRIRGLRANSSRRSHAELNDSPDLDEGNPEELGQQYRDLRGTLTELAVIGGCCGTDERHVEAMCRACVRATVAKG